MEHTHKDFNYSHEHEGGDKPHKHDSEEIKEEQEESEEQEEQEEQEEHKEDEQLTELVIVTPNDDPKKHKETASKLHMGS